MTAAAAVSTDRVVAKVRERAEHDSGDALAFWRFLHWGGVG